MFPRRVESPECSVTHLTVAQGRVRIPVAVLASSLQISTFCRAKRALGAGLGAGCKKIRRPRPPRTGQILERYPTRLGRLMPAAGSNDGTAQGERRCVRLRPPARGSRRVNYARRQQYRRCCRRAIHAPAAPGTARSLVARSLRTDTPLPGDVGIIPVGSTVGQGTA